MRSWLALSFALAASAAALPGSRHALARTPERTRAPALKTLTQALSEVAAFPIVLPEVNIELPASTSRATGFHWRGRLKDAATLSPTSTIRYFEGYEERERYYGHGELVGLLEHAADVVANVGSMAASLTMGDLGAAHGGRIVGHRSHQNGLDADVGFYFVNEAGAPTYVPRMARVGSSGRARLGETAVRFDLARNWKFVETLLTAPGDPVQFIFVANTIRADLLAEARRQGVTDELFDLARKVLRQPRGNPHRDHYHVRLFCPTEDVPGCRDRGRRWSEMGTDEAAFDEIL